MNGLSIGPSLLKLVGSHLTLPFFDNLLFFAENTYQCMFYARIPIWSDDHSELPQCHELWRTEVRFTFHSQFLLSFRSPSLSHSHSYTLEGKFLNCILTDEMCTLHFSQTYWYAMPYTVAFLPSWKKILRTFCGEINVFKLGGRSKRHRKTTASGCTSPDSVIVFPFIHKSMSMWWPYCMWLSQASKIYFCLHIELSEVFCLPYNCLIFCVVTDWPVCKIRCQ